ncbi:MAG: fatty acid CoA ligase family protein [Nannocystaceae bacterium]
MSTDDTAPGPAATVADVLPRMAAAQPDTTAIYFPTKRRDSKGQLVYDQVSYRQLDERSDRIAAGLHAVGIERGHRAALMVRPSPELFALTFGMFKAGVVPVMIDPGLGMRGLGQCLQRAEPSAFVGIPLAHAARIALRWARSTIVRTVTVGRFALGGHTLAAVEKLGAAALREGRRPEPTRGDEIAAVLFTSGSTGPPKGVVYRHRNFLAQVESIREMFGIEPGEIDLPTFPMFALFDPALGMTTVLPDMDPTKPAQVDPRNVIEPIQRFGITTMFGSPALLNTVGRYGAEHGTTLPSLRRVIAAGAPMTEPTLRRWHGMLSDEADVFPPYGATESLPVACLPGREILADTWPRTIEGAGVCVGRPVPAIEVKVLRITDEPISSFEAELELPPGQIGEIAVRGPMVTEEYYGDADNTAKAKIRDGQTVWHRMGDLGWRDDDDRLWFCGRKSHRVQLPEQTLFTISCEKIFDTHEAVYRTALVGPRIGGAVKAVLCVELEPGVDPERWPTIRDELAAMAKADPKLEAIGSFVRHPGFPVDIRHNAKIGREKLGAWVVDKGLA